MCMDKVRRCRYCGVELTEENCYPSYLKKQWYICKKCHLEYKRRRYWNNPEVCEKEKQRLREYRRRIGLDVLRERARKRYREDDEFRERLRRHDKKYRQKYREIVLKHYGGDPPKCECCGESRIEFLTIDHIRGGGTAEHKRLGRYGTTYYKWLIDNNFPEGLRVLCYNCNCSRGNYGYCPHEREKLNNRNEIITSVM